MCARRHLPNLNDEQTHQGNGGRVVAAAATNLSASSPSGLVGRFMAVEGVEIDRKGSGGGISEFMPKGTAHCIAKGPQF